MKTGSLITLLGLTLLCARPRLHAQADVQPAEEMPVDVPQFYFDALSFMSDQKGMSRLDVYLEVPYEQLHFTNVGQAFSSNYEVTMSFYDSDNKLIDEKWWRKTVETRDYNESISTKQSDLAQRSFILPPKEYILAIQITDSDTKKTFRRKRQISVRDFSPGLFATSDVMIVKRLNLDGPSKVVYPNISGSVGDLQQGFYIFFEAYNRTSADSATILVSILNGKKEVIRRDSCRQALDSLRSACFCNVRTAQMPAGVYLLSVNTIPTSSRPHAYIDSASSSIRTFEIHWRGLPTTIGDLDLALDQMQYIMDKDDVERIKLMDAVTKREKFLEFWKKKDPSPNTERNELMEEYFARVDYANKHFTHYYDGWKTDMGMVYIIFGAPSNIERHPFDTDARPYEIWTYYEKSREFVFVDVSGFGDYKLQTPIWDDFSTRPRPR